MLFSLGVLGFVQGCYLPGVALLSLLSIRMNALSFFILAAPISFILNYFLTLILTVCSMNDRPAWMAIVLLEVGVIFFLRKRAQKFFFRTTRHPFSKSEKWVCSLALFVALYHLTRWIKSWGTVIHWTDTALSWNRWALEWYQSEMPTISRFYPQVVSVLLSIPYQFTGQTEVEFFSLSLVTGIPLLVLGAIISSFPFYPEKRVSLSVALIGFCYLVSRFAIPLSGYADAPLASSIMLVLIYATLQKDALKSDEPKAWLLGAGLAGLAALTKQLGVLMIFIYPMWVMVDLGSRVRRSTFIRASGLAGAIAFSWYGIKLYDLLKGSDMFGLPGIVNTVPLGFVERIWPALQRFDQFFVPDFFATLILHVAFYLGFFWALLRAWSRDHSTRFLVVLSCFGFLFWVWVASYDSRNMAFSIPFVSLWFARSIGNDGASSKISSLERRYFSQEEPLAVRPVRWALPVVILGLIVAQVMLTDEIILDHQRVERARWVKQGAVFLPEKEALGGLGK